MDYQWKYRVVKRTFRFPNPRDPSDDVVFAIYKAYIDEDEKLVALTERESYPAGETADELKADIGAMMEAFQLPVLDYGQITEEIAKAKS